MPEIFKKPGSKNRNPVKIKSSKRRTHFMKKGVFQEMGFPENSIPGISRETYNLAVDGIPEIFRKRGFQ